MNFKITQEAKSLLETAYFAGGAEFSINEREDAVELLCEDGDVTPSDVGRALAFICKNKAALDNATTFSIDGWHISGLDESNFGLVNFHTIAYERYGSTTVAAINFNERESVGAWIDDDTLFFGMEDFYIGVSGEYVDDFIKDGELDFDAMVEFDLSLSDEVKKTIFYDLKTFLKEKVTSTKIEGPKLYADISVELFGVMRLGKDQMYAAVEQDFLNRGIEIDIEDMQAIPMKIENGETIYRFIPTDYKLKADEKLLPESVAEETSESITQKR